MSGFTAESWEQATAFTGRLATREDVDSGAAVFGMADTLDPAPLDEPLPQPAIWYEDEEDEATGQAVLIVQAERHATAEGDELEVMGLLLPDGRTAVGFSDDLDLVDGADPVWRELVEDALFSPGGAR